MKDPASGAVSPLDPDYYTTSATPEEKQFRADFARVWAGLEAMQPQQPWQQLLLPVLLPGVPETCELDALAARWRDHPLRCWRENFLHLRVTTVECEQRPSAMRELIEEMHAAYLIAVEPLKWRNYLQAAELTELAPWCFATDLGDEAGREHAMPWTNAAEISTSAPVPVSSDAARARTRALVRQQKGQHE